MFSVVLRPPCLTVGRCGLKNFMHSIKIVLIFILSLAFPILANTERSPVKIEIESHDDVYTLHNMGISIENLRENYVETHLYPEEIERLRDAGYRITEVPPQKWTEEGYHNYYEVEVYLDSMHIKYPELTKKDTIGYSVQGKNISAFLISDYPDSEETEPEIKFGATIHGNEPVGTELCLNLISYLLDSYETNDSIAWLINNTETWFVPLANPNGRQAYSRYNANEVDLNRNYPVPDGSIGEDSTYDWEPETRAMIDFCCQHNFVISTMFHGGALVVNYQWDYDSSAAPDSGLIQLIALGYSWRNGRMWNHGLGYYGTIDGWYWYPVYGSLQDWAYDSMACIDLTIELDDEKWPDSSRLSELWDENRDAMIYLIEKIYTGVAGMVTDAFTGEPLSAEVRAIEYGKPVFTDPDVGDYYKLLRDGVYTMQFSSPGYITKKFEGVYVKFDSLTILNVCLSKSTGIEEIVIGHQLPVISVYPNPFSTTTAITLSGYQATNTPHSSPFALRIYDLSGRLVWEASPDADNRGLETSLTVLWDGRDKNGILLPAGIYFYRYKGENLESWGKLVMIR